LVKQYNISLGGDVPIEEPWLEHILPNTLSDDWTKDFPKHDHDKWKHTLANLIPLTPGINQSLSNVKYSQKRECYQKDAMFKAARILAATYDAWTPLEIERRANQLSVWAVERWPV
jgi:hypothetical protein